MKCVFCGKSVGLFKKEHPECRQRFEAGQQHIRKCIDFVYKNRDCANIREVIADTIKKCNISPETLDSLNIQCWKEKVDEAFSDNVIEDDEIQILREIGVHLGISIKRMLLTPQGKKLFEYGQRLIRNIVLTAINSRDLSHVIDEIDDVASKFGYGPSVITSNIMKCYENYIDEIFEDGIIDEDEEEFFGKMNQILPVTEDDTKPYLSRVVKGIIIRELFEGKLPQRLNFTGIIPLVLQKGESVIWIFNNVKLYEDKTSKHYVGGSSGMSVRVAKGIYYRTSAFKGYPVETTETLLMGIGQLFITNKHIFFSSADKSIKIPAKKITSLIPKANGIIIQKDGVRAKPEKFLLDDPWFAHNLISNLNLIE